MVDTIHKTGCDGLNTGHTGNAFTNGVVFLVKAPFRLAHRVFGPLGHKTIFLLNDLCGDTKVPPVRAHPLIASVTGVSTVFATFLLVTRGLPYANALHAAGMDHYNNGRLVDAGINLGGAVAILALTVSALFFTTTGLVSGVLFGTP